MDKEIMPCPFCGSDPRLKYSFETLVIECCCEKCTIKPSTWLVVKSTDFNKILKAWNSRRS